MFRALWVKHWVQLRALRWVGFGVGIALPFVFWAGAEAARRGWFGNGRSDYDLTSLIIDSARFAENAYFIKLREPGYQHKSVKEIVREIFSHADGMTMSAKKDTFSNMGGWLALNNDDWAEKARTRLIMTEGFPTYGGLSGRDMECIATGLEEIVHEDYLQYRIRSIQYINERLDALGIPVIKPAGGHAIFIDAKKMLAHIPSLQYPGQALAVALYIHGGIRGV